MKKRLSRIPAQNFAVPYFQKEEGLCQDDHHSAKHGLLSFMAINVSVKEVGKRIGGKVQQNIEMPVGGFENACPIRMSYVLNKTGFPIRRNPSYAMVSGGDGMWYIYRVADMRKYLTETFGVPDKYVNKKPDTTDFKGLKGIVIVTGYGWGDAGGHVTLWDGKGCADSCHLMHDPDNGSFVPQEASLWELR